MTARAAVITPAEAFGGISGLADVGTLGKGSIPLARTTPGELRGVLGQLRDRGFTHLSLLTAAEIPAEKPAEKPAADADAETDATPAPAGVKMVYEVTRQTDHAHAMLTVDLPEDDLRVPTIAGLWSSAVSLEREVFDLFGVVFLGHPNLRRIVLRDDFPGHPLRKGFEMPPKGVDAETVAWALSSHGDTGPQTQPERSDPTLAVDLPFPSVAAALERPGDTALHSDRELIHMGPQHPSMHGVLHLWVATEGEKVIAAEMHPRLPASLHREALRVAQLPRRDGARRPQRLRLGLLHRTRAALGRRGARRDRGSAEGAVHPHADVRDLPHHAATTRGSPRADSTWARRRRCSSRSGSARR